MSGGFSGGKLHSLFFSASRIPLENKAQKCGHIISLFCVNCPFLTP